MDESKEKETLQEVSELDENRWSVVSFERLEASGLSYADARRKIDELEAAKVSGLCIITDDAAARIAG